MAYNPSKGLSEMATPTKRANDVNEPNFENAQGYFPYDLTHQEFITPRFGEATPSMFLHTVAGDRIAHHDNMKTILNQVNGNLLSTINQYVDSYFVPLRSVFPYNYEKLIPNPTKGDDLPNLALPQFPVNLFFSEYLDSTLAYVEYNAAGSYHNGSIRSFMTATSEAYGDSFKTARFLTFIYFVSRGQLLDYLGVCFDDEITNYLSSERSEFQTSVDAAFRLFYEQFIAPVDGAPVTRVFGEVIPDLLNNTFDPRNTTGKTYSISNLSEFRDAVATCIERGMYPYIPALEWTQGLFDLLSGFVSFWQRDDMLTRANYVATINASEDPFNVGHISLEKPLAYQQIISQYFTNDHVDNVFNSELFMQNLRSVMYPSSNGRSVEYTFDYNGVSTEYDLISAGGLFYSLISGDTAGNLNRQYVFGSLMFVLRRTLRYGDYFSTARPNMLAVGQLSINVEGGAVSPIDVTKNLLMQRYLNAANYIGSGFLQYMNSMFGVMPSDTGTFPRFIAHRVIPLANDVTTNTADNQGYQTTNLIGVTDNNGFDVFIDDFGVVMNIVSYDVLPVYKSGIDSSYHFSDRFDFFNPMLQGIGDQHIRRSELIGNLYYRDETFGYTMRNAEYKYKVSRAHGAFVNSLSGFLVPFPISRFDSLNIDPDFIRDKPAYLDSIVPTLTGVSPAEYFHFAVSCTNEVNCARKIQLTPPVLF